MDARRHGQREGGLPLEMLLSALFVLQMFKVSVDEEFIHYFKKMLSAFVASPTAWTLPLWDFRISDPLIARGVARILHGGAQKLSDEARESMHRRRRGGREPRPPTHFWRI